MKFDLNKIYAQLLEIIVQYSPKLIMSIVTLLIGLWVIQIILKIFKRLLKLKKIDKGLSPYLINLLSWGLKALLIVTILGMLGVQIGTFLALFGAMGIAFGMALSGTLQNFASGVMILLFKPFSVGDFIEVQGGSTGKVKEILIFSTIVSTRDNKTVIIPNSKLSNETLINFTRAENRLIVWEIGVSYDSDIKKAKNILNQIALDNSDIIKDKNITVAVSKLDSSSVVLVLKSWVLNKKYIEVLYQVNEEILSRFNNEGIKIPYGTFDVNLFNKSM